MSVVLDASMAVTWLFENEHSEASHAVLHRVALEGALVPSIWRLEVANVLRNALRRGRCDERHAERSLKRLERLPIRPDEETFTQAWSATRKLSLQDDLTLYDAAYLELAIRAGLPLASCDDALLAAAERRKLPVLTA